MTSTGQKIFAIGDIHGCHDNLVALMGRLPIDKSTDKLVFLGDFINRGPDTKKVVETLLEVRASYAHVVFLMGNHEQALLEYSATGDLELLPALRAMGVEATLASYGASARGLSGLSCMPQEHRDFLNSLEFFHVVGNYLFTHADFDEQKLALAGARPDALAAQRFAEAGLLASRRLGRENNCRYRLYHCLRTPAFRGAAGYDRPHRHRYRGSLRGRTNGGGVAGYALLSCLTFMALHRLVLPVLVCTSAGQVDPAL